MVNLQFQETRGVAIFEITHETKASTRDRGVTPLVANAFVRWKRVYVSAPHLRSDTNIAIDKVVLAIDKVVIDLELFT